MSYKVFGTEHLISFISIFCCGQLKFFFMLFHFYELIKEKKRASVIIGCNHDYVSASYSIVESSIYRLGPTCITCYFATDSKSTNEEKVMMWSLTAPDIGQSVTLLEYGMH